MRRSAPRRLRPLSVFGSLDKCSTLQDKGRTGLEPPTSSWRSDDDERHRALLVDTLRRPPAAGAPPAREVARPSRHCRVVRPALFRVKFEAWTRRTGNDLHHGQVPFVLKPNPDKQPIFGIASRSSLIADCRNPSETLRGSACPGRFLSWPGMRATDGNPSRQVPPRGLGARRGSTRSGQKELALLGQCEPQRGNGFVPTALPQDRRGCPVVRRN